jgi:hypothetical protein
MLLNILNYKCYEKANDNIVKRRKMKGERKREETFSHRYDRSNYNHTEKSSHPP